MIEPLPKPLRHYLAQFGLGAIAVSSSGEIQVLPGKDLARMDAVAACWWVQDLATAHQVARAIGEHVPASLEAATAEILAAAKRIDVVLSEHAVVVDRAQIAVDQLSAKLTAAQQNGALKFFNSEYRRRREAARASGNGFMSYNTAMARLRQLLAGAAAGAPPADLVRQVFEQ